MSGEENEPGELGECGDRVSQLQPGIFTTRAQLKRANKKREKLARRAVLARAGDVAPPPRPAPEDDAPTAMIVETSLRFGCFERHTTGNGFTLDPATAALLCLLLCSETSVHLHWGLWAVVVRKRVPSAVACGGVS